MSSLKIVKGVLIVVLFWAPEVLFSREDKSFSSFQDISELPLTPPFYKKKVDEKKAYSFNLPHITIRKLNNPTSYREIDYGDIRERQKLEALRSQFEGSSGILKYNVITRGSLNGKYAFLYINQELGYPSRGIWLALFDNERKQWLKYHTGLADNMPLHLKRNSSLPLFKNSNWLQVEAAFMQEFPSFHPITFYKLLEDGFVIELDISKIVADTDEDGLTDIVENMMMLDPEQRDTDNDGIIDSLDPNPRFNLPRTEITSVYEAVMKGYDLYPRAGYIPVPTVPLKYIANLLSNQSVPNYFVVSDSKHVQSISLSNVRLIIVTSQEYEMMKDSYPSNFQKLELSPLSKVNNEKDTYEVSVSILGSTMYKVRKGKNGWEFIELYRVSH